MIFAICVAAVVVAGVLYGIRKFAVDTRMCECAPDLRGKVVVVTGTTSGIGGETARRLAELGATVVLADRRHEDSKKLAEKIATETNNPNVESVKCDLGDLESVGRCAEEILQKHSEIHILVNNAGVMACPLTPSKQGYELQYAVNHLGHFLLTANLLPALIAAKGRVVSLASEAHAWPKSFDFGTVLVKNQDPATFKAWYGGYGRSKAANVLFIAHLQKLFGDRGIATFAVNPGNVSTNLGRHFSPAVLIAMTPLLLLLDKSVVQGAQTTLQCCLAPESELALGGYHSNCVPDKCSELCKNEAVAKELWDVSLEQVKDYITPAARSVLYP